MRVFIALNIPPEIKKKLLKCQEEIKGLFDYDPVKWVKGDCIHITLAFLGTLRERDVESLKEDLRKIRKEPFEVFLNKITYVPPERRKAKMIWVKGESKELETLQKEIEKVLIASNYLNYLPDERGFTPHITLGRVRKWDLQRLSTSQIPILEEEINLSFKAESFELMESKLKKGGPEYKIVSSFSLK